MTDRVLRAEASRLPPSFTDLLLMKRSQALELMLANFGLL